MYPHRPIVEAKKSLIWLIRRSYGSNQSHRSLNQACTGSERSVPALLSADRPRTSCAVSTKQYEKTYLCLPHTAKQSLWARPYPYLQIPAGLNPPEPLKSYADRPCRSSQSRPSVHCTFAQWLRYPAKGWASPRPDRNRTPGACAPRFCCASWHAWRVHR